MKTIFSLLLATIFTSSAFAYDESRLTITVSATSDVQVMIDNRSYRLDDNSLVLNNIQSGRHTIQVYRKNGNNGRGYGNNKSRNNRNEVLYSSTIYVKPNYDVDIMINRFGKALVDERDLRYANDGAWKNNDRPYDRNDNNGGYGNYPSDRNYHQAMSEYDFNQLVQKIRSQIFGNGKMNSAKDAFSRNYFTTQQVRQVLDLFSSDNDKLELAKLAYRNTVDQRNYSQLYDVFAFKSSRDELDQYIRNNRW
jgi:hypothetical protein